MKIFIPNTKKRYSINEKGVIYSHYRYFKNSKIYYRKIIVKKHISQNINSVLVSLFFGKKRKDIYINTLMINLFKLKLPDKYHFYDLKQKDGNIFNHNIKNLEYKIRLNRKYKFYPQPFYNKNGRIIHKICGNCGKRKIISNFNLQNVYGENRENHKTFRNICESCRTIQNWNHIKSDIKLLLKVAKRSSEWAKSKEGKKYYSNYDKKRKEYNKKYITNEYIRGISHLKKDEITPQLIELITKQVQLKRLINNLKTK